MIWGTQIGRASDERAMSSETNLLRELSCYPATYPTYRCCDKNGEDWMGLLQAWTEMNWTAQNKRYLKLLSNDKIGMQSPRHVTKLNTWCSKIALIARKQYETALSQKYGTFEKKSICKNLSDTESNILKQLWVSCFTTKLNAGASKIFSTRDLRSSRGRNEL